jgi:hypothetical protein
MRKFAKAALAVIPVAAIAVAQFAPVVADAVQHH